MEINSAVAFRSLSENASCSFNSICSTVYLNRYLGHTIYKIYEYNNLFSMSFFQVSIQTGLKSSECFVNVSDNRL